MPDITLSFTDAQWARMEAAGVAVTGIGTVSEDNTLESLLVARLKKIIEQSVIAYERENASLDSF
jgi:hypothetical protein|tara:strand:+ start:61 stop:255 length:195 start_codon:yes stop_codon:yes gene_type:complete